MIPTNAYSSALSAALEAAGGQNYPPGALYVVATPIGNLADITLRALHVLGLADTIACEDTRHTQALLRAYGIDKSGAQLLAVHQHNEAEAAQTVIERLQQGQRVAYASDAGTPAISDPGAALVAAAQAGGYRTLPIPGASSTVAALSVAGDVTGGPFTFVGFLPSKAGQRDTLLQSLTSTAASLIFYEAPHRIIDSTAAMLAAFGPQRQVVFARELTKLFEEIHRCNLSDAAAWLKADPHREKGEYVVLLQGAPSAIAADEVEADRVLRILLAECSVKQAAALAAQLTGQKKNALYERALVIKAEIR